MTEAACRREKPSWEVASCMSQRCFHPSHKPWNEDSDQNKAFRPGPNRPGSEVTDEAAADLEAGFLNRRGSARSAALQGGRLISVAPVPRRPACEIHCNPLLLVNKRAEY